MGLWTDKHLPQIPFTGKLFSMTTFCITFYESYLSAAQLLTCRGHVGESCGEPLPPGEPRES
jgi:hypothetical protein